MATDNYFSYTLPPSITALEEVLNVELEQALITIGEQAKQLLVNALNDPTVRATGKSAESIERDERPLRIGTKMLMRVFPTGGRSKVMRYINDGRKPGKRPPVDAIVEWMIERELDVGMSDRELRGVAFVIARKIGRDG